MSLPFRIAQLSDTHISDRKPEGVQRLAAIIDELRRDPPDLVVHTGDIVFWEPDNAVDHARAKELMSRLPDGVPVFALAGNHDIGERGPTPWNGPVIREDWVAAFGTNWGPGRFVLDPPSGTWRVIGIDAMLIGTGLARAAQQRAWLAQQLAEAGGPVLLFIHQPLRFYGAAIDDPGGLALNDDDLESLLATADVRIVSSGHLHRYRVRTAPQGWTEVWAPSTLFIGDDWGDGAELARGWVELTLHDEGTSTVTRRDV